MFYARGRRGGCEGGWVGLLDGVLIFAWRIDEVRIRKFDVCVLIWERKIIVEHQSSIDPFTHSHSLGVG